MSDRRMSSKYRGTCSVCDTKFPAGTSIIWSKDRSYDTRVRHDYCDIGDKIDKSTGKTYSVLAQEWEVEHQNDMTLCERAEGMLDSNSGWGLNAMSERDQDTAFQYAMEDKERNPWI
tara:strand:- start:111 stop:461 length:351 start_codon:yes stop_codon:yes gene_type:complete